MKIRSEVVGIYNNDVSGLIESLRHLSKEDRFRLYGSHSKMLFPRSKEVINLEDQLIGRSDYIHKFKKSFTAPSSSSPS